MLCSTVRIVKLGVCREIVVSVRFIASSQQLYKDLPKTWGSRKSTPRVTSAGGEMDPKIEEQLTPLRQAVKEQVYFLL